VPGKAKPVGTHRGDGATMGRRGRLRTAAFRWRVAPAVASGGGVLQQGAVAREAIGGASEQKRHGGVGTEKS
jgi:hypothetical protein